MENTKDGRDALRSNVFRLRARKGLTLTALAERSRVSREIIEAIQSGKGTISAESTEKVAQALSTFVTDLFVPPVSLESSDEDDDFFAALARYT